MGKPEEVRVEVTDLADAGGGGGVLAGILSPCAAGIRRTFSARCLVVLALSACVLLSAVLWLPPFRALRSGFVSDDTDSPRAEIQASFILQNPISLLALDAARLEYDIFEEIGIPNTKVSVISMNPLAAENSTYVVFGLLRNPKNASISSPALSILRSTLIDLVLQKINMSLQLSVFGHPSSFELLKFPGGITVIPQSASIWNRAKILFDFTLNNTMEQILNNINRFKDDLWDGLNLRSYENVYVKLTNANGSTVAPPVTVEASVLSDESGNLLPDRMKQLAQLITRPGGNNLGLNNSVFGKVKKVQLSSYLEHSISFMAPSPSPSTKTAKTSNPHIQHGSGKMFFEKSPPPSPSSSLSDGNFYGPPPASLNPTLSPFAPNSKHPHPPCFHCHTSPSESPVAPSPQNYVQYHPVNAPGPSQINIGHFHNHYPSPSPAPKSVPPVNPFPPLSSGHSHDFAITPSHEAQGPTPEMSPKYSPLSPATSYASSPEQESGISGRSSTSPVSSLISPSPSPLSKAAIRTTPEAELIGLLGLLIFQVIC